MPLFCRISTPVQHLSFDRHLRVAIIEMLLIPADCPSNRSTTFASHVTYPGSCTNKCCPCMSISAVSTKPRPKWIASSSVCLNATAVQMTGCSHPTQREKPQPSFLRAPGRSGIRAVPICSPAPSLLCQIHSFMSLPIGALGLLLFTILQRHVYGGRVQDGTQ